MPKIFSSASLINGSNGVSHTTVGIPSSFKMFKTSIRRAVVQTPGSIFRLSTSSIVVSVICMTHFVFALILQNKSKSRSTLSDFVSTVNPNPYRSISSAHCLVRFNSISSGIYGSLIAPVPIIHFFRFLFNAASNNCGAFSLTSISSNT